MHSNTIFAAVLAFAATAVTATSGATGPFACSSPLGIQPHPTCCKNVTSADIYGDVQVSQCYINTGTVGSGNGDCSTGPTQYAGYKGVCCFNTFRLSGGTFPYPTIVDPSADDCIAPTA